MLEAAQIQLRYGVMTVRDSYGVLTPLTRVRASIAQGAVENLFDLTADELRTAINRYLGKGPDFLKFGGTNHFWEPTKIGFSPEAQKVMVEEAHKRGLAAETHSTALEGLRLSIDTDIDLIQHPEVLTLRKIPEDLLKLIRDRHIHLLDAW